MYNKSSPSHVSDTRYLKKSKMGSLVDLEKFQISLLYNGIYLETSFPVSSVLLQEINIRHSLNGKEISNMLGSYK